VGGNFGDGGEGLQIAWICWAICVLLVVLHLVCSEWNSTLNFAPSQAIWIIVIMVMAKDLHLARLSHMTKPNTKQWQTWIVCSCLLWQSKRFADCCLLLRWLLPRNFCAFLSQVFLFFNFFLPFRFHFHFVICTEIGLISKQHFSRIRLPRHSISSIWM